MGSWGCPLTTKQYCVYQTQFLNETTQGGVRKTSCLKVRDQNHLMTTWCCGLLLFRFSSFSIRWFKTLRIQTLNFGESISNAFYYSKNAFFLHYKKNCLFLLYISHHIFSITITHINGEHSVDERHHRCEHGGTESFRSGLEARSLSAQPPWLQHTGKRNS